MENNNITSVDTTYKELAVKTGKLRGIVKKIKFSFYLFYDI